jgi:hypothetical protein
MVNIGDQLGACEEGCRYWTVRRLGDSDLRLTSMVRLEGVKMRNCGPSEDQLNDWDSEGSKAGGPG